MTFSLNEKELELLTEVNSPLLEKYDGVFIAITKNEADQFLKELFELRKRVDILEKYGTQLNSLINKTKSLHPKF